MKKLLPVIDVQKDFINEKTNWSKLKTNYWIPVEALCLVIGDKSLFLANSNIDSKVIVMMMIKQLSLIITIILGKILFKEKDIVKKIIIFNFNYNRYWNNVYCLIYAKNH